MPRREEILICGAELGFTFRSLTKFLKMLMGKKIPNKLQFNVN